MKKTFALFAIIFAICAFIAPVNAARSDAPQAFVEGLSKNAIATLTEKDITPAERDHRFRVLLNQNFDVPSIGRFALGRYWRSANTEQQQEYLRLFESVIVATYSARFSKYSGQRIEATDTQSEVDSILVRSKMINPDGSEPVMIDWRLKPNGSGYKITDLIVEGVSMSITQRSEYSSVIERSGGDFNALLAVLRKKASGQQQASVKSND